MKEFLKQTDPHHWALQASLRTSVFVLLGMVIHCKSICREVIRWMALFLKNQWAAELEMDSRGAPDRSRATC